MQILPNLLASLIYTLRWSIITTSNPGEGLVALPGFDGNVCKFLKLHEIIHPVSVYQ